MDTQTVTNILVAVAVAHSVHSIMEPMNIRAKVARLVAYMDKKPAKEMPINIDTRPKALGLGYSMFVVMIIAGYFIVSLFDPGVTTAMWFVIAVLVANELINTATIDAYHVDIEKVTKRFK